MLGKWKFRTQFENDNSLIKTCCGDGIVDKFVLSVDKHGCSFLKKVGIHNLYDYIQSHRDSCDLNVLLGNLDSAQVNGLMSSFSLYDLLDSNIIDLTSLPTNLGEMHRLCVEGENYFNGLPIDIREQFNFSSHKFISEFGTPEFNERMNALRLKHGIDVPTVSYDEIKPSKRGRKSKVAVNPVNLESDGDLNA